MNADDLDLPTLTSLAGGGVVREVLARVSAAGFVGVRPSHGYVIQRLVEDEPTISALATSLGITQQGASKQVRELEGLGYVERVVVVEDARARRVRLTPRGRGVLESGRAARGQLEEELAARVGEHEVRRARVVLAELLDVLGMDDQVQNRSVPLPEQ